MGIEQRRTLARAAMWLALILVPSLSSAAIFKCTAQDGSITYTDVPCPVDATAQSIDAGMPAWLKPPPQIVDAATELPDATSQSQPELIAELCANDEYGVWLRAQRQSLPERDVRAAKFIELSNLCRKAMHLPKVAEPAGGFSEVSPVAAIDAS